MRGPPHAAAVLLVAAAALCLGGRAEELEASSPEFNYPAVFNFGDSNSDTGGRVAAGFESIAPPYGSTFFGSPSGRFCDGRLIIDFLSKLTSLVLTHFLVDSSCGWQCVVHIACCNLIPTW
jgi:hypothetical protein